MPNFYFNVNEEISIEEFVDECDSHEITELVKYLIKEKKIELKDLFINKHVNSGDYDEIITSLIDKKHLLTLDEENVIMSIGEKYKHF